MIMKIIEYSLCATILSKEESNRLARPIYNLVLLKCKIDMNILLVLKYGLIDSIGLGFNCPFIA